MYNGNDTNTNDFLEILMALKRNTMKNTHVADVCMVTYPPVHEGGQDNVTCKVITTGVTISAIPLDGMTIHAGDIVVVLYTDTDFRSNFRKLISYQPVSYNVSEDSNRHDQAFGVIIGILFIKDKGES